MKEKTARREPFRDARVRLSVVAACLAAALGPVGGCCTTTTAAAGGGTTTSGADQPSDVGDETPSRVFSKLTPVLVVETIEPSLELWVDRLGFVKTMEVPTESGLGFVGLGRDGIEIMYQTKASVAADDASLDIPNGVPLSTLYIEVEDLDWIVERLGDVEVLVPLRETDYGMREIFIREPGGYTVGFAESLAPTDDSEGAAEPAARPGGS